MISSDDFINQLKANRYGVISGVPCSYLTPLINGVINDESLAYVNAANEGEAVSIAAGSTLGGRIGVAMFQNSGLGNAVSPLTSLTWTFRLPILLIVTWRGQPGGSPDEPQHELMGQIMMRQLQLMEIPVAMFPSRVDDVPTVLNQASEHFDRRQRPFALVMTKGSVEPQTLQQQIPLTKQSFDLVGEIVESLDPDEVLRTIVRQTSSTDIMLATTGFTGRALYAIGDRGNQLYMVGSMGCVSSLAAGLQLVRPNERVIVLDGDGSLLMRLGSLPAVAACGASRLVHVVLDNQVHDSTGAQSTLSGTVDIPALAIASGYRKVVRVASLDQLVTAMVEKTGHGPTMIYVRTTPRSDRKLPRPTIPPSEVACRLQRHLGIDHLRPIANDRAKLS